MSAPSYPDFFRAATQRQTHCPEPFAYQTRLAEGTDANGTCISRLIDVPTGCGKTAAVALAWLWNRVVQKREDWPRRLVYCLPMRTLVEQTRGECRRWFRNVWRQRETLGLTAETIESLRWMRLQGPVLLMGGAKPNRRRPDWDTHPERDAILIGTQDMLLSRALNRGYGMSRYRWPMHFGLLNNDCLWVMDETQLMGVGVETSAQFDAFRARLGTVAPTACWWMSATLDPARLATVDQRPAGDWPRVTLPDEDRNGPVRARWEAEKTLAPAPVPPLGGSGDAKRYARDLAALVRERHIPGTLTLVVLNRVLRAQAVYKLLAENPPAGASVALVHSRFRPPDRASHERTLFAKGGSRVVIATQAVEAGVDVSARTLLTELAPWSSLVQRFGRCNRYGECNDETDGGANVFWLDLAPKEDKDAAPYTVAELAAARELLRDGRTRVGPRDLAAAPRAPEPVIIRPVLRRKDLLDLFDTTPDLCGNDLDIGRYVRDGEDTDAQVFWRDLPPDGLPPADSPRPVRPELCRVSVVALAEFVKKNKQVRAFVWNALDGKWERLKTVRPGLVILLDARSGGYSPALGWTGAADDAPVPTPHAPPADADPEESYRGNRLSYLPSRWVKLTEHTDNVVRNLEAVLAAFGPDRFPAHAAVLRTAARWHDVGKAHEVFQEMLTRGDDVPTERRDELQGKSDRFRGYARREGKTSPFRHELASALAWLQAGPPDAPDRDLIAYVIAAHHGRVRLSIRSLPDEKGPRDDPARLFARGVWHGDDLPRVPLNGLTVEPLTLDLGYMQMGEDEGEEGKNNGRGPSWLARTLALRDDPALGPFRLAFLETLLRVADWRASADEKQEAPRL